MQVLHELYATLLGGHLVATRRSPWRAALRGGPVPAAVEQYVRTCPTCQRVKADHLLPADPL